MMKRNRRGWLFLLTGLFLTITGNIFGTTVTEALRNINGQVSMNKVAAVVKPAWKGGETLNIEMVKKIKKEFDSNLITYTVKTPEGQKIADWSGKGFDAVIGGVDDAYSMFHNFIFLNGCFFLINKKTDVLKSAMISEEFSWKIFRTVDATGMHTVVYGETFRISGVFKIRENILSTLVHPYMPDILLPAETLLSLDDRAYIDSLELMADDSVILGGNSEKILSALRMAGADTERFITEDFTTSEKFIRQRPMLLSFIAGLATVLMCGAYIFKVLSEKARFIFALSMAGSINDIKPIISKMGLVLILPVMILIMAILLLHRSGFEFYFPAEYIPGETLDGKKYSELIKESLLLFFSGVNEEAPTNVRILQAANLLSCYSSWLSFFTGLPLVRAGIVIIENGNGTLGKAALLQSGCVLAAYALCLILGLTPEIFTEGLIILWIYISFSLIIKNNVSDRSVINV